MSQFHLPEEGVAHIVLALASKHPSVARDPPLPGLFRELGRIGMSST